MSRKQNALKNLKANTKSDKYRVANYTVKDQVEYNKWNKEEAAKYGAIGKTFKQEDGTTHRTSLKGIDIVGKSSGTFKEVAKKAKKK